MSEEEAAEEQTYRSEPGEGGLRPGGPTTPKDVDHFQLSQILEEKGLTFEEASRCLNTLGKDESGARYAYLMMTATDMKLTNVDMILNFKHVLFIDVSGNFLKLEALQVLTQMPYLVLLRATLNRVESAALRQIPFLQVLDLSRNQITETCDIDQPLLECLILNYNEIYTAQLAVERLANLKQLEMRGNHLFDLSGNYPMSIENLYLAQNSIGKIIADDLAKLTNLRILHLRDNVIRKLNGFSECLVNLSYLNLRRNKIQKIRQFRKLACLSALETLIVSENPATGIGVGGLSEREGEGGGGGIGGAGDDEEEEEEPGEDGPPLDKTRLSILVLLPSLKRINKLPVSLDERNKAHDIRERQLEIIMAEDSSDDETEIPTTTDFTEPYTSDADFTENAGTEEGSDEEEEDDEDN